MVRLTREPVAPSTDHQLQLAQHVQKLWGGYGLNEADEERFKAGRIIGTEEQMVRAIFGKNDPVSRWIKNYIDMGLVRQWFPRPVGGATTYAMWKARGADGIRASYSGGGSNSDGKSTVLHIRCDSIARATTRQPSGLYVIGPRAAGPPVPGAKWQAKQPWRSATGLTGRGFWKLPRDASLASVPPAYRQVVAMAQKRGNGAGLAARYCDYIRRPGAEEEPELSAELISPAIAAEDDFWTLVEKGARSDGRTQYRMVASLPSDEALGPQGRRDIVRAFAAGHLDPHALPWEAAVHVPGGTGDPRNFHVHLIYHDRPRWRAEDGTFVPDRCKAAATRSRSWIKALRAGWYACVNEALERVGLEARYDARRYDDRPEALVAEVHLGKEAAALEARGLPTAAGIHNASAAAQNFLHSCRMDIRSSWFDAVLDQAEEARLHGRAVACGQQVPVFGRHCLEAGLALEDAAEAVAEAARRKAGRTERKAVADYCLALAPLRTVAYDKSLQAEMRRRLKLKRRKDSDPAASSEGGAKPSGAAASQLAKMPGTKDDELARLLREIAADLVGTGKPGERPNGRGFRLPPKPLRAVDEALIPILETQQKEAEVELAKADAVLDGALERLVTARCDIGDAMVLDMFVGITEDQQSCLQADPRKGRVVLNKLLAETSGLAEQLDEAHARLPKAPALVAAMEAVWGKGRWPAMARAARVDPALDWAKTPPEAARLPEMWEGALEALTRLKDVHERQRAKQPPTLRASELQRLEEGGRRLEAWCQHVAVAASMAARWQARERLRNGRTDRLAAGYWDDRDILRWHKMQSQAAAAVATVTAGIRVDPRLEAKAMGLGLIAPLNARTRQRSYSDRTR
jgi:hypothetical protein